VLVSRWSQGVVVERTLIFDAQAARKLTPAEQPSAAPTLVVDLDGTLLKTDMLLESLLALLKQKPLYIFLLTVWLLKGKAYLKQQIATRVELDVTVLPYRLEFLEYLQGQHARGRSIVLATAADMRLARQVANHLKIFDLVLASDGTTNLAGKSKRDLLVNIFGAKRFDYAANDWGDLVVWSEARKAIVVNPGPFVNRRAAHVAQIDSVFKGERKSLGDYLKPLRLQHWVKNILVFVPLLVAHRIFDTASLEKAVLAFVAFGCCASGGYLLNALFDLTSDRHHPHKRARPFASGDLWLSYGLAMISVLVVIGCMIGLLVSPLLLAVLLTYFALTATYSFYVRTVVILDVIVLAALYTMRIMAGSVAVGIWPSHWLLAFSTFLFFSLALVKRYGELVIMKHIDGDRATARGYELDDEELLAAMGIASGYLGVLVLALYINTDTAQALYGRYELIWFLCPLLFYWISHIWLVAHRGKMPDDPVVFAIRDRTSQILALLMLATTLVAL
jgi:4-hydroxybenzoate polyprenyltransferase